MIVLDSGDALRGDAAAATIVDYTIYGLDNNVLKQLADGQLASSTGDLYTANSVDVVTTIIIVNTDSVARAINLFLLPSAGTARRIIPKDLSLGAGFSLQWSGDKISVMNASGEIVTTTASGGTTVANDTIWDAAGDLVYGTGSDASARLAAGATTEILVGGGAAPPVWTTASGTGAPVRASSPTLVTPALGTPSAAVLTSATGLPISTGVSGLAANVAAFLADPTSAKLLAAVTDETGTGLAVFATAPTLTGATLAGTLACADQLVARAEFKDYSETPVALTIATNTLTLDLEDGNVFSWTADAAATTFVISNWLASKAQSLTLFLTQGGTAYAIDWTDESIIWAGGTPPDITTVSTKYAIMIASPDGGTTKFGSFLVDVKAP